MLQILPSSLSYITLPLCTTCVPAQGKVALGIIREHAHEGVPSDAAPSDGNLQRLAAAAAAAGSGSGSSTAAGAGAAATAGVGVAPAPLGPALTGAVSGHHRQESAPELLSGPSSSTARSGMLRTPPVPPTVGLLHGKPALPSSKLGMGGSGASASKLPGVASVGMGHGPASTTVGTAATSGGQRLISRPSSAAGSTELFSYLAPTPKSLPSVNTHAGEEAGAPGALGSPKGTPR